MDYRYKAFISYRHRKTDMAMAEKLHRRIESYRAPKELTPDRSGSLGKVFRDKDELTVSGSLSTQLQEALDSSEFLLVICSRDTPGSRWVSEEIRYFLRHHDREHVLAVLIDGLPEDSFPRELTEVYDADGRKTGTVEPLAANFSEASRPGHLGHNSAEYLRIFAALLGCSYDALYRREQRRRRKRTILSISAASAVVLSFIALLVVKNTQIREQLEISIANEQRAIAGETLAQENRLESMKNESTALARLAVSSLEEGDRYEALRLAVQALEGEDRPWNAGAEAVLRDALNCYELDYNSANLNMSSVFDFIIRQDTRVDKVLLSDDGGFLASLDRYYTLHMYSGKNGVLLWSFALPEEIYWKMGGFSPDGSEFTLWNQGTIIVFDSATGETLRRYSPPGYSGIVSLSPETGLAVVEDNHLLTFIDLSDHSTAATASTEGVVVMEGSNYIDYTLYRSAFSPDGAYFAFCESSGGGTAQHCYILELATGEITTISVPVYEEGYLLFSPAGDLAFVTFADKFSTRYYQREKHWHQRFCSVWESIAGNDLDTGYVKDLYFSDDCLIAVAGNVGTTVRLSDGSVSYNTFAGYAIHSELIKKSSGLIGLIYDGGNTDYWNAGSGVTLSSLGLGGAQSAGFSVSAASSCNRFSEYALVQEDDPCCIAVMRPLPDPGIQPTDYTYDDDGLTDLIVSSSGSSMYLCNWDTSEELLTVSWIMPESDGIVGTFSCSYAGAEDTLPIGSTIGGTVAANDSGMLVVDGFFVDIAGGNSYLLSGEEGERWQQTFSDVLSDGTLFSVRFFHDENRACCVDLYRNGLQTGHISLDAPLRDHSYGKNEITIHFHPEECIIRSDGAVFFPVYDAEAEVFCGYARIEADGSVSIPEESLNLYHDGPGCISHSGELICSCCGTELVIFSADTGEIVDDIPGKATANAIAKVMYGPEDKTLFVFLETGAYRVYDAATGRELFYVNHSDTGLHLSASTKYRIYALPEDDRYAVIMDNRSYTQSSVSFIDLNDNAEYGSCVGPIHYVSEDNCFFLMDRNDSLLYAAPHYSTEELLARAHGMLPEE